VVYAAVAFFEIFNTLAIRSHIPMSVDVVTSALEKPSLNNLRIDHLSAEFNFLLNKTRCEGDKPIFGYF
jgi:hypothetical protein